MRFHALSKGSEYVFHDLVLEHAVPEILHVFLLYLKAQYALHQHNWSL